MMAENQKGDQTMKQHTDMDDSSAPRGNLILSSFPLKQSGDAPAAVIASDMFCHGGRIYHFGGADELAAYDQLHVLAPETGAWAEVHLDGIWKPSSRYGHSASSASFGAVIFGGLADSKHEARHRNPQYPPPIPYSSTPNRLWAHQGEVTNELFLVDLLEGKWEKVNYEATAAAPTARAFHAATVMTTSNREFFLVWGGACAEDLLSKRSNDLYVMDLQNRQWIPDVYQMGDVPSPRLGHKMAYVPDKSGVYLFGGAGDQGALYFLDLQPLFQPPQTSLADVTTDDSAVERINLKWSKVKSLGGPPTSRSFHSLDLLSPRKLLLFGGLLKGNRPSDAFVFDVVRNKWTRPLYEEDVFCSGHASAVLSGKVVIYGGARIHRDLSKGMQSNVPLARISRIFTFMSILELRPTTAPTTAQLKLITIGDSAVGKSCLLERFVSDIYTDSHFATVGVDFFSIVTLVRGKLVTLQLWDTAGQERFGVVTANYYRNGDGFVFVYDCTKRDSFDHILQWIERVKEHHSFGEGAFKLLIGNKQDLVDQVQVTHEEGIQLAEKIGAVYLATSAKTGAGVDTAFLLAANQMMQAR